MAAHIRLTSRLSLTAVERLIYSRVAVYGEVWVWADPGRNRTLLRLRALLAGPVPGGLSPAQIARNRFGGDMALFGSPDGSAIDGSGGLLVVSARPFPEDLD